MSNFHVKEIVHVEGEEGGTKLKRRANDQPTNKSLIEKNRIHFIVLIKFRGLIVILMYILLQISLRERLKNSKRK